MRIRHALTALAAAAAMTAGLIGTAAIPAGADVRAVEIDKAGYLTDGGAGARVRVAVTADRGDLVAITLNIYQNRQALDVDGNAWWGWVKFGDPAPGAQPFRMIVEMAAVPTI
jgi:hypothetical protein